MYFGRNCRGVMLFANFTMLSSFGVVEKRISNSETFSEAIITGARFIFETAVVFVGIFCEQTSTRHKYFAFAFFGSVDFEALSLQHFIGQTFSFIFISPPCKGVPENTLTESIKMKNKVFSRFAITFVRLTLLEKVVNQILREKNSIRF